MQGIRSLGLALAAAILAISSHALAKGTTSGADWHAGGWAVGRGLYAGGHTDRAFGFIDEVRISDSALTPNAFLAAPKPRMSQAARSGGNLGFHGTGGPPGRGAPKQSQSDRCGICPRCGCLFPPEGRMLARAERAWALFALGLPVLLASCAPDEMVTPRAEMGRTSADVVTTDVASGPEFYASPDGSPTGDGSFTNPWDLGTTLSGPAAVTPGSTIWLRGGTYMNPADPRGFISTLRGTAEAPIVVRQYPGERATVTNAIAVEGAYTWLWGFEVTNTAQQQLQPLHGVNVLSEGSGTKLINLVVHDATDDGIFLWPQASGVEVNGSIVYNNGRTDNLTHGIYCGSTGATLLLQDNIVFDNWATGFHCYSSDEGSLNAIDLEGNVAFNNYVWGVPWDTDILVGGLVPAAGPFGVLALARRMRRGTRVAGDAGRRLRPELGRLDALERHFRRELEGLGPVAERYDGAGTRVARASQRQAVL